MCYGISFAAYIYVKMQYYTIYFGASMYALYGWMDEMHMDECKIFCESV